MTCLAALCLLAVYGVTDGDSVRAGSPLSWVSARIETIDTPEIGRRAECLEEYLGAERAKRRLTALVAGGVVVEYTGRVCGWDRPCVRLRLADGRYAGGVLVAEGLAVPWSGRRNEWC